MQRITHQIVRIGSIFLQFFIYLVVSYSVIFFIMHAADGSPLNNENTMPLTHAHDSSIARIIEKPLPILYINTFKNFIFFNWGTSFFNSIDSLVYYIPQALSITLLFTVVTVIVSVLLSLFLALIAIFHPKKWLRSLIILFIIFIGSLPHVIIAPILFILISRYMPSIILTSSWFYPPKFFTTIILISLPYTALFAKLIYIDLKEATQWFHLKQLLAMGFSLSQSLWCLRNRLLSPISRYIGIAIPQLLSGFILVEDIFRIPALGSISIEAINRRDYPIILITSMIFSLSIWIFTRLALFLQQKIDPRVGVSL
ncbi:ABC transporter permease [Entomospira nematocerorum]|uniref:ABC transporter permease n=1 Tax=Entomospira nematocerorum TaxID=2719987 RepID=A0A968GEK8_9SPIO|nr:ABC transporter permease [Entomospira nematocera]NIZ46855.1 ABC transporter permease [Entomospira nematocera]WDI33346.1 ABC transporter permease [Entomospira nematocera]